MIANETVIYKKPSWSDLQGGLFNSSTSVVWYGEWYFKLVMNFYLKSISQILVFM